MSPHRILFVHPYTTPGGPSSLLRGLLAHLDPERVESHLAVLPEAEQEWKHVQLASNRVVVVRGLQTMPRSLHPLVWARYVDHARGAVKHLRQIIADKQIDLVHMMSEGTMVGGLAALRSGVPAVTHVQGLSIGSPLWVGRMVALAINYTADVIIAVSQAVGEMLRQIGIPSTKIVMIPNGVDLEWFSKDGYTRRHASLQDLPMDTLTVAMIANLDPRKGHEDFIDACALVHGTMPKVRFVVVGADVREKMFGPRPTRYAQGLMTRVQRSGLEGSLTFLGPIEDIRGVIGTCDLLVQPSHTEAAPLAPLEAMVMGRPVVATSVGGNPETVRHGVTGLIVPPKDPQAIASAIMKLVADTETRLTMGINAQRWVMERFDIRKSAEQVLTCYESLLAPRRVSSHVHSGSQL